MMNTINRSCQNNTRLTEKNSIKKRKRPQNRWQFITYITPETASKLNNLKNRLKKFFTPSCFRSANQTISHDTFNHKHFTPITSAQETPTTPKDRKSHKLQKVKNPIRPIQRTVTSFITCHGSGEPVNKTGDVKSIISAHFLSDQPKRTSLYEQPLNQLKNTTPPILRTVSNTISKIKSLTGTFIYQTQFTVMPYIYVNYLLPMIFKKIIPSKRILNLLLDSIMNITKNRSHFIKILKSLLFPPYSIKSLSYIQYGFISSFNFILNHIEQISIHHKEQIMSFESSITVCVLACTVVLLLSHVRDGGMLRDLIYRLKESDLIKAYHRTSIPQRAPALAWRSKTETESGLHFSIALAGCGQVKTVLNTGIIMTPGWIDYQYNKNGELLYKTKPLSKIRNTPNTNKDSNLIRNLLWHLIRLASGDLYGPNKHIAINNLCNGTGIAFNGGNAESMVNITTNHPDLSKIVEELTPGEKLQFKQCVLAFSRGTGSAMVGIPALSNTLKEKYENKIVPYIRGILIDPVLASKEIDPQELEQNIREFLSHTPNCKFTVLLALDERRSTFETCFEWYKLKKEFPSQIEIQLLPGPHGFMDYETHPLTAKIAEQIIATRLIQDGIRPEIYSKLIKPKAEQLQDCEKLFLEKENYSATGQTWRKPFYNLEAGLISNGEFKERALVKHTKEGHYGELNTAFLNDWHLEVLSELYPRLLIFIKETLKPEVQKNPKAFYLNTEQLKEIKSIEKINTAEALLSLLIKFLPENGPTANALIQDENLRAEIKSFCEETSERSTGLAYLKKILLPITFDKKQGNGPKLLTIVKAVTVPSPSPVI